MIDFKALTFGDSIFIAKEENHVFSQKRITMIDANGIEWYRYDRDRFTYAIEEIVYCGKVTYIEEGEIRFDENHSTEYHFKHADGQIYPEYYDADIFDLDRKNWFHSLEEAELRIAELKALRSQ